MGIGPIVTASIVLQLLVGADIIKLNLSDPRDQAIYQGTQKALVFLMVAVEGLPQVLGGYLLPDANVANALGVSLGVISLLIFIQVFIGGSLIVYMDEVVSKWGVGSGVGLFIVAGISQQLVTGLINPATGDAGLSVGIIPKWIDIIRLQLDQLRYPLHLGRPAVYLHHRRNSGPDIHHSDHIAGRVGGVDENRDPSGPQPGAWCKRPLPGEAGLCIGPSHDSGEGHSGQYRDAGGIAGLKAGDGNIATVTGEGVTTVYTGYSSLLGNFISQSQFDSATGAAISGSSPQPVSGLMYYLSPIGGPSDWIPSMVTTSTAGMTELGFSPIAGYQILLHVLTDSAFLIIGGILFAIFWIETTGMGPKSVAAKIHNSGLQVPGYRRNPASIEKLMERYIPKVTVIGGVIIGVLTLIASLLGTLGERVVPVCFWR